MSKSFNMADYAPKCERCGKTIVDDLRYFWREFRSIHTGNFIQGTICRQCVEIVDGPKDMEHDDPYRKALAQHKLGT